jgi:hypothetical protein
VKWTETPGLVFDPTPAPRIYPDPVPEPVRDPAGRNHWIPDWTVVRDFYPVPVFVEIGETRSVRIDVFRRPGGLDTPITFIAPLIEVVRSWKGKRFNLNWIFSYQSGGFSGLECLRNISVTYFQAAAEHGD